jgi:hypothetical protein
MALSRANGKSTESYLDKSFDFQTEFSLARVGIPRSENQSSQNSLDSLNRNRSSCSRVAANLE